MRDFVVSACFFSNGGWNRWAILVGLVRTLGRLTM